MLLSLFKQDPLAKSLVRGVWKVNHVIQYAALLTAKSIAADAHSSDGHLP